MGRAASNAKANSAPGINLDDPAAEANRRPPGDG
jgi:hypothetical protein